MSKGNQISPLIEFKIETHSDSDRPKLVDALEKIVQQDTNVSIKIGPENGEIIVGGETEFSLDRFLGHLKDLGINSKISPPQISFRETITRRVKIDFTHKRIVRGMGEYARVIIEIEPTEIDVGNSIELNLIDNLLPDNFAEGIEKGLDSVLSKGPIFGFPVVNLNVKLTDSAYHETDSSFVAFEIAARAALREAIGQASPVMLEPVMSVAVKLPSEFIGSIIGDLNSRCGKVMSSTEADKMSTITAHVPLAKMFGYQVRLATLSKGFGTFGMKFSHYQTTSSPSDPDNFPPAIAMRA